jgi:3-phenylpropionate/trans-cinnamate dioxygenase ferredoxin reductase subunit
MFQFVKRDGSSLTGIESWRNARSQAEIAAQNMAGAENPFATSPWFWSSGPISTTLACK